MGAVPFTGPSVRSAEAPGFSPEEQATEALEDQTESQGEEAIHLPFQADLPAPSAIHDASLIQRNVPEQANDLRLASHASLPVVQREEETAAPAQAEAPQSEAQTNPRTTRGSAPATDLDALARQVYEILNHRLRVEHERARGWNG
jgi:hypothetical protein